MRSVSQLQKIILGTGICGGALLYYYLQPRKAHASWTTNYIASNGSKWDDNWDQALQFPAEAWLRLSLNHASITWISITPNGRVILRTLGDSGHMPPEGISYR